jgi:anhydro-N-acetylmuramic acid kinase
MALHIGLMSGTSLDGVDAVLADFTAASPAVSTHYVAIDDALRHSLKAMLQSGFDELERSASLGGDLARLYARAVGDLLAAAGVTARDVAAIGCHGQTVRHRPERGFSSQLVNAALLAELTELPVVCDFRSRDIAAGGQGAPLVPAFHAAMFRHPMLDRVIVNLGGIANLTWLPASGAIAGFDCGPANALLDEWAEAHLGTRYDARGEWAAGGRVIGKLLQGLLGDAYFRRPPPKSTGREYFDIEWAGAHIRPEYRHQDVQATLAELSATVVSAAIESYCAGANEVFLCGGGVSNTDLVGRIARRIPGCAVSSTAQLGIDPDWVEAMAFAWLARETLAGRPGNRPEVTGARGLRVLGCIYPA